MIQLQDLLAKGGSSVKIDGCFGLGTRNAVRAFQKKHNLIVNGVVDSNTWLKLLEVAGNIKFHEPEKRKPNKFTLIIPNLEKDEANHLLEKYQGSRIIT